uniref:hypothetical protein n=1 Tax=Stenotrophomonas maltophilia TaxID=40324 RepID=UPI001952EB23
PKMLYGFEAAKASALHAALDRLRPLTDWRPETLVWHIRPDARELHTLRDGARQVVGYEAVILCTGAMD